MLHNSFFIQSTQYIWIPNKIHEQHEVQSTKGRINAHGHVLIQDPVF